MLFASISPERSLAVGAVLLGAGGAMAAITTAPWHVRAGPGSAGHTAIGRVAALKAAVGSRSGTIDDSEH